MASLVLLLLLIASDRLGNLEYANSLKRNPSCPFMEHIPRNRVVGGHTARCFQARPMSFAGCKLIFRLHSECQYMSYSVGGKCWLYGQHADFTTSNDQQYDSLTYRKIDEKNCPHNSSREIISLENSIRGLKNCGRDAPAPVPSIDASHLPLLAIVLSITEDWPNKRQAGFKSVVSNFKCYCSIHGYSFVSACL